MPGAINILPKQRVQVQKLKVDLEALYKHLHAWLEWRGFNVVEKKYRKRMSGEIIAEMTIEWVAIKEIDSYTAYQILITFDCYGLKESKIEVEGVTRKVYEGDINVYIQADLLLDYQQKWESSPFLKFLQHFFENFIYKSKIETYKSELWEISWALFNEVKAFLNLYRWIS